MACASTELGRCIVQTIKQRRITLLILYILRHVRIHSTLLEKLHSSLALNALYRRCMPKKIGTIVRYFHVGLRTMHSKIDAWLPSDNNKSHIHEFNIICSIRFDFE